MKRGVVFILLFILLATSFAFAEENDTNITPIASEETTTETSADLSQIDKAYKCLEDKVKDECSTSPIDNIFTLLAIKKCGKEVKEDSHSDECWPESDCSIKMTSQAVLALDHAGYATSEAEDWLFEQNNTPDDIYWYLEIESPEETICEIRYDSKDYTINIGADKKISSSAGSCLSLSTGNYWLRVSPSCYDEEFEVSCDESFLTTLLFKKKTSSTIHVSETTHSASAEGTTKEQVLSLCFTEGATCDYEGSLWATLVLDNLGYDVSAFIPYLITMADENSDYLPEAFLYALTGYVDFRSDLLLKQKKQYWQESGDKFYDTALALYPFTQEDFTEKENSKKWLLEIQGDDGCWDNGKIASNGFILASIFPRGGYTSDSGNNGGASCASSGYYCMSSISCEGNILSSYDCSGVAKCCDQPATLELCANQGGEICASNEYCSGGTTANAADASYGDTCCIGGSCQEQGATSEANCGSFGGTCRPYGCESDEDESFTYNCDYGDTCCISQIKESTWWIWLLLILIILIIVAIIFRDRLRPYYEKVKSRFKKGSSKQTPRAPPFFPPRTGMQRRILPPSSRPIMRRPPMKKPSDFDDVLKKLKDMGG